MKDCAGMFGADTPKRIVMTAALIAAAAFPASAGDRPLHLDRIKLPPGFSISVFARVDDARSLALAPSGTVFVGNRSGDSVYALVPTGGGTSPRVVKVAGGLRSPNGVAFRNGDLYVAEVSRVIRFPSVEKNLSATRPLVVKDDFPDDDAHGWKFIAFGPDGRLYVPVGAPCNVCDAGDPYSSITRMKPDGSDWQVFARGIRNTVGFDWHPGTGELWFTENGRDNLGDDIPSDELNRAPRAGMHFGFPYYHAEGIPDPRFSSGKKRADYVEPEALLGPHVAALGMRFYRGAMFPEEYRGRVFIAQHGSWNRSEKIGYRVMTATIADGRVTDYRPFATGWLQDGHAWGRPVDVQELADGSLLVSDDYANVVYRITYRR